MNLLGDTLSLGIDEASQTDEHINTSIMNRFQKVNSKVNRWENSKIFPNIFARSLAAKTYLISEFQYILSYASLSLNQCGIV